MMKNLIKTELINTRFEYNGRIKNQTQTIFNLLGKPDLPGK